MSKTELQKEIDEATQELIRLVLGDRLGAVHAQADKLAKLIKQRDEPAPPTEPELPWRVEIDPAGIAKQMAFVIGPGSHQFTEILLDGLPTPVAARIANALNSFEAMRAVCEVVLTYERGTMPPPKWLVKQVKEALCLATRFKPDGTLRRENDHADEARAGLCS